MQQWQTFLKSRYQKLIMQINSFGLKQRQEFIPLKYTVKTAYKILMSSGADRIDAGPLTPAEWKALWKLNVQER